jgi:hypothetical protein
MSPPCAVALRALIALTFKFRSRATAHGGDIDAQLFSSLFSSGKCCLARAVAGCWINNSGMHVKVIDCIWLCIVLDCTVYSTFVCNMRLHNGSGPCRQGASQVLRFMTDQY